MTIQNDHITCNPEETYLLGSSFTKKVKPGEIVCLYGNLGTGKTTFLQGFAKGLGITQRIISPTFVIVRKYRIKDYALRIKDFYHIDLYRTEKIEDLKNIGLDEILSNKNALVAIEWAEKLKSLLTKKRWELKFQYDDADNKRKIIIKKYEK